MKSLRRSGLVLFALASAVAAARAEQAVVVSAQGIAFAPGRMFDLNKSLVLRAGQHLTLVTQSGETIALNGPYSGRPAAVPKNSSGRTMLDALIADKKLKLTGKGAEVGYNYEPRRDGAAPGASADAPSGMGIPSETTGGALPSAAPPPAEGQYDTGPAVPSYAPSSTEAEARAEERARRNAAAAAEESAKRDAAAAAEEGAKRDATPDRRLGFDLSSGVGAGSYRGSGSEREGRIGPWIVQVDDLGATWCVREGSAVVFGRLDAAADDTIALKLPDGRKVERPWPHGTYQLTFKTPKPIHAGAIYTVSLNGGSESALSIVPRTLTTDAMRAAWMANVGCLSQAELLARANK